MEPTLQTVMKEELAKQGEIMAKQGVECAFALIYKYVETTDTKVDDAILPFLALAKEFVLAQCDKIDGE